jgi:hypothetical protein
METNEEKEEREQGVINQMFSYAANLLVQEKKSPEEVRAALKKIGLDEPTAVLVVDTLEKQIQAAKKESANKDMLYGALWCVGGIIATAAHIGFIFWGAIIFGAIQFFKGVANA